MTQDGAVPRPSDGPHPHPAPESGFATGHVLPFQNRNFLHEKKGTSLCTCTTLSLIQVSVREGTILSPYFSASRHYVAF